EARVRARVKPTQVRPKQDRRDRRRGSKSKRSSGRDRSDQRSGDNRGDDAAVTADVSASSNDQQQQRSQDQSRSSSNGQGRRPKKQRTQKEQLAMEHDETNESDVSPTEVGDAAVAFMNGLAAAFGADATTDVEIDGTEIDVRVSGEGLGLLVGPGGRTLTAVEDLARVSSQRRLGDHETRLRIDVGGYREKRKAALEKFAMAVAGQVIEAGATKALEPMSSADRKVVHDAITDIDGVTSRSEGDEPNRRVVISPA
ncbi:MAG: hypothetical protein KDB37_21445, partial [Ilumatobacter sp.]|nr:hypothetical protein [Ilumatobacter sp.]